MLNHCNYDWKKVVTPINVKIFNKLLCDTEFEHQQRITLIQGFTSGFDLGYRGPETRKDLSENILLRVGTRTDLWNKVMKEVNNGRFAGPYAHEELPVQWYVQSPIGLVPKANNKQRLICHLSYDFGPTERQKSINYHTPQDLCSVKYQDLDEAIRQSLALLDAIQNHQQTLVFSKTDFSNAFRILPILVSQRCYLLMAYHLQTGNKCYFIDLCLPFSSSRSCALFQKFSDAVKHVARCKLQVKFTAVFAIINYLDDFLFISFLLSVCNGLVKEFLRLCKTIGCPVSLEKTEMASEITVFLGVLLDGKNKLLVIPDDKRNKATSYLTWVLQKKKVTIKFVQQLTGILNFLNKVIVPGRAFTREMYEKLKIRDKNGQLLKQHHHTWLSKTFLSDCTVWLRLLNDAKNHHLCRPFVDFLSSSDSAITLQIFSDASRNPLLGMGAVFLEEDHWIIGRWNPVFITSQKPSIEFLELIALAAGIMTWGRSPL